MTEPPASDLRPGDSPPADPSPAELSPVDLRLLAFNERVLFRMFRTMLIVGILLVAPALWKYKTAGAVGFAAGAAVSCINFRALQGSVESLGDRIVNRQSAEKGGSIVFRFLVRYALVGAVAYAIFNSSAVAFRGFLWGLCLPVAAMMIEAGFETYAALRK
ncbi:MAG: ATP synthase subunit I [Terriglobales bacterium]